MYANMPVRKTADGEGVVSFGKFLSSSHAANFIIIFFFFFLISRFCFLLVLWCCTRVCHSQADIGSSEKGK